MSSEKPQPESIGNKDLVRLVLWFCSEKISKKESSEFDEYEKVFKGTTKLQKLIFLAQNELQEFEHLVENKIFCDEKFDFKADNYGPYSADLQIITRRFYKDDEIVIEKENNKTVYYITTKMKFKIASMINLLDRNDVLVVWISKIVEMSKWSLDEILNHVYTNSKYKEFLENSLIRDKYSSM